MILPVGEGLFCNAVPSTRPPVHSRDRFSVIEVDTASKSTRRRNCTVSVPSIHEWLPGSFAHIQDTQGRSERVPDHRAYSYRDIEGFGKHRTPILSEDSNRTNHIINEVVNLDWGWNLRVTMQDEFGVRIGKPKTD